MKRLVAVFFALALFCSSAGAQNEEFKKPRRSGYFFIAPGAISLNVRQFSRPSFQIGGGFEGFIYRGLGIGMDIGGLRVGAEGASQHWTAMMSLGAIYDFQHTAKQKVCPFIAAGLTAIPQFDVAGGYHLGGGVKYWFAEHYGMKVEFRFQARPGNLRTYDDVQARIGIAIR